MTHARVSHLLILPPLALALLAGGCSTPYQFSVDALAAPGAASSGGYSYRLVEARPAGADAAVPDTGMRDVLRTALSARGLFEAPPGVVAGLDIEFAAGMSGPIVAERTYTKPEYVVHQVQVPTGFGNGAGGEYIVEARPELHETRVVTEHVLEYRKHLDLVARVPRDDGLDGPPREVWRVRVENQDSSRDLDRYVRLMAAAALDVIGKNAQTRRTVTLTDRDGRVLFVQLGTR